MTDATMHKGIFTASRRRELLLGLFLLIAVLVAYGPALPAGFVWDDDVYVTNDTMLTKPDALRRIWFSFDSLAGYFPLTLTTFYAERGLWALNPAGYHLVNILLHAANAILVWQLLKQLRVPGAWLAGTIFALHPVQVESVAWITERKNVLMGFFFLLSLLAWRNFADEQSKHRWRFYTLALVFYILALCAKTTACTLPAGLILILWLRKIPTSGKRWAQVAPFVVIGIGMGLIAMSWERYHHDTQGKLFEIAWLQRGLIASHAIWFYAAKIFWPANLTVAYPRWTILPTHLAAYLWVAVTAVSAVFVWWLRRWTGRGVEAAVVFFVATLAPMLGLIMHHFYMYSFVADHFQYLASLGLIALVAAGIEMGLRKIHWGKRALRPVLYATVMITLGVLTWNQSEMYADAETLWQTTLRHNPDSLLAQANLGSIAFKDGQLEEASTHFQKILQKNPDCAGIHYNLGLCLFQAGRIDEAMAEYKKELDLYPDNAEAHNNLGQALAFKGQQKEAIAEYQRALALAPDLSVAQDNLGLALLKDQKVDEAIVQFKAAVQSDPSTPGVQNNLGIAFTKIGQFKQAVRHFEKALEINADDLAACNNLAWLLATAPDASVRDGAKALLLAQQASQSGATQDPMILQTLSAAEAETGDYKGAVATVQQALELAIKHNNEALKASLQRELGLYQHGLQARDAVSRWNW